MIVVAKLIGALLLYTAVIETLLAAGRVAHWLST